MSVTIIIPTALRQYASDQEELKVEVQTVGEADWKPSPKRPPAIRKSGNACTVCSACTYIFSERFCKY